MSGLLLFFIVSVLGLFVSASVGIALEFKPVSMRVINSVRFVLLASMLSVVVSFVALIWI